MVSSNGAASDALRAGETCCWRLNILQYFEPAADARMMMMMPTFHVVVVVVPQHCYGCCCCCCCNIRTRLFSAGSATILVWFISQFATKAAHHHWMKHTCHIYFFKFHGSIDQPGNRKLATRLGKPAVPCSCILCCCAAPIAVAALESLSELELLLLPPLPLSL